MAAKRKSVSAKAGATAGLPGRGLRVLVVDDAEGIRTYLANLLELSGYCVDTAEDGRSALALLDGGAAPDVVVLDVMMPGIDGIETLRQIRDRHGSVPVVMLSVVGKASTIVEAMQLGASDYINKPFEEEEFQLTLDKVLEQKSLERQRQMLSEELQRYRDGVVWASPAMQENQRDRLDPRRERSREGNRRAHRPLGLESLGASLRQGELCSAPRRPSRKRTLRLRKGRFHRRDPPQDRKI